MTAAVRIEPHAGLLVTTVGGFTVTLVRNGDRYGLNNCLTHAGDPMVEFYDARFIKPGFTTAGQFVARYLSTLRKHTGGLALDLGIPEWTLTAAQFEAARVAVERAINPGA